MNTRCITLLLLLAVVRTMGQSTHASGKATYELGPQADHHALDFWFTTDEYSYQYRQITDIRQTAGFKNKRYSSIQDSLNEAKNIDRFNDRLKGTPPQIWYGKLGSDEIIFSSFDNSFKTYCVKDTAGFVKWELLADTMTIRGLACQKATGTYNGAGYTAWFTSSIPVSVAPLQFRGLPGLLVKVTNDVTKATLTLTDLEWPAKTAITIQPCSGSPFISKSELQNIRNAQNANARKLFEQSQEALKAKARP